MRRGFTTGSCAAAAAKAAAYMLLSGRVKTRIQISTPGGEVFDAGVERLGIGEAILSAQDKKAAVSRVKSLF